MLELLNPRPDLISEDLWAQIQHQARMAAAALVLEERCNGMQREQAMVFTMLDRQKAEQRESLQLVTQVAQGVLQTILASQRIFEGKQETTPPVGDYEDPESKPTFDLDSFLRGYAQAKGRLDLQDTFAAEYMVRSCFAHRSVEDFTSYVDEVWNAVVAEATNAREGEE